MANVEHIPPPHVVQNSRNVSDSARNGGNGQRDDDNGWAQPMDYWYNRVISKSSPAATTANPSALGLIAFGYTTALLQVCPCLVHCFARFRDSISGWRAKLYRSPLLLLHPSAVVCAMREGLHVTWQGANTKWTEMSTEYVTVAFALFFGGLVQLLAGMWEFRRNNMFAATALSSYGGFWLSYGIYTILAGGGVIEMSGPQGLQMAFSLWGIMTFLFFL